MDWGNYAEWLGAFASLTTACIAAWVGLRTYQQQRTSADVKLALSIFETINRYWDRIADNHAAHYHHDMGQIFSHFELAAMLFNKRTLSPRAQPILENHIADIYMSFRSTDEGRKLIDGYRSSENTFCELDAFLKTHVGPAAEPVPTRPVTQPRGRWRKVASIPLLLWQMTGLKLLHAGRSSGSSSNMSPNRAEGGAKLAA